MRNVRVPHALPISLATVSLPPAASAAVNAISAGAVRVGEQRAMQRRAAAKPVFAIALPAPRRAAALFGDAEQRLALRAPSRELIAAARNVASEQQPIPASRRSDG